MQSVAQSLLDEGNTDFFGLAPHDLARLLERIGQQQVESVRDADDGGNLEPGPLCRQIAHRAVDRRPSGVKRDRAALEGRPTLRGSIFAHRIGYRHLAPM